MEKKIITCLWEYMTEGKKENRKYDYGCVMCDFTVPDWDNRTSFIRADDVYTSDDDNSYGIEDEPHVTILYGLHEDVDNDAVVEYLKNQQPVIVKILGISIFENDDYDVIKYDIESDILVLMNEELKSKFSFTNNYPDYMPHMTIGYVKSGEGKKYIKSFEEPEEMVSNVFSYSKVDGSKDRVIIKQ